VGVPITTREKANILEAAFYLRIVLGPQSARMAPYLKGGVGLEHVEPDLTIISQYSSIRTTESHLWGGFLGGIGLSMKLADTSGLRLEVLFHRIQSEDDPGDLVTVGIAYGWIANRQRRSRSRCPRRWCSRRFSTRARACRAPSRRRSRGRSPR
jgi:hypothetical protein